MARSWTGRRNLNFALINGCQDRLRMTLNLPNIRQMTIFELLGLPASKLSQWQAVGSYEAFARVRRFSSQN